VVSLTSVGNIVQRSDGGGADGSGGGLSGGGDDNERDVSSTMSEPGVVNCMYGIKQ